MRLFCSIEAAPAAARSLARMRALLAAAVVNYQTPDLLETAVRSFHAAYPDVPVLVVDNGSRDDSPALIRRLQQECGPGIEALLLAENVYHGPAMHLAMQRLETPFVFFFDSDTETLLGGFLEPMVALLETSVLHYGAGQVVHVNRRGFVASAGIPVLTSWHMLLKRSLYLRLPPFRHHGLPVLRNFQAAAEAGYVLQDFPVQEYVRHLGRGTVARYGYQLGLRSKLDYLLHRLGL